MKKEIYIRRLWDQSVLKCELVQELTEEDGKKIFLCKYNGKYGLSDSRDEVSKEEYDKIKEYYKLEAELEQMNIKLSNMRYELKL